MSARYNKLARLGRQAAHERASERPELLKPTDGCARVASKGATSPPIKQSPDQELIDAALKKRSEPNTVLGAG